MNLKWLSTMFNNPWIVTALLTAQILISSSALGAGILIGRKMRTDRALQKEKEARASADRKAAAVKHEAALSADILTGSLKEVDILSVNLLKSREIIASLRSTIMAARATVEGREVV